MIKKLLKDKRGVFGLNAVQQFFIVILGIALLAYVIVIIMGSLNNTTILPYASTSALAESGLANGGINNSGYVLGASLTQPGFAGPAITTITNITSSLLIPSNNYTLVGNIIYNSTATVWDAIEVNYTYQYYSVYQKGTSGLLANVSTGITGFFGAVNPVYAILAVLVIILVLVVLVRVVSNPSGGKEQL